MGSPQPKEADADWSSLPAPLAKRILRQAFQGSGRTLVSWLRLSLVCKCELRRTAPRLTTLCATAVEKCQAAAVVRSGAYAITR